MSPDRALVAEVLEKAADLIEPEGRWTQGALARGGSGIGLDNADAAEATCWCAAGALQHFVGRDDTFRAARELLLQTVDPDSGGEGLIAAWNDAEGRTQAEVVAALRSAAAKAREPSHPTRGEEG